MGVKNIVYSIKNFFKKISKKELIEEEEVFLNDEKKEGMLVVDVYQTDKELVVQAPLAGVKKEDVQVMVEEKILKIFGERKRKTKEKGEFLIQECHFGPFSREIVLPENVSQDKIRAKLENGILEIRLPLLKKEDNLKVEITEVSEE